MKTRYLHLALSATALLLAAPGAHAFTMETLSNTNGDQTSIVDPDQKFEDSAKGNTTSQQGGLSFHFSAGPSYGSRVNPFFAPPGTSPFPPSSNMGAFPNDR